MGRKTGRPTKYTEEIATIILDKVADGVPLIKVCEDESMPDRGTVRRWRLGNEAFRTMYAQAREEFADSLADELLKIADDSRVGTKTKTSSFGEEITTGDMVERARLQIDTRKWLAAKILPKKYGDKLDVTTGGERLNTEVILPHATGNK